MYQIQYMINIFHKCHHAHLKNILNQHMMMLNHILIMSALSVLIFNLNPTSESLFKFAHANFSIILSINIPYEYTAIHIAHR